MSNQRTIDWAKLRDPFAPEDIEWMLTPGSVSKKSSGVTAKCLAYVTSRAVQERFDEVLGPENWRNEFEQGPSGGVLCGLSIRLPTGDWLTKWDGAENTDIEPVKGGLSGAIKRAASQFGVGRYLYYLPETWAIIGTAGRFYANQKVKERAQNADKGKEVWVTFHWDPPTLPAWALPGGSGKPPAEQINKATGEVTTSAMRCPCCESPLYDNRADKAKGKVIGSGGFPDLRCSNKKCEDPDTGKPWAAWLDTWTEELYKQLEAAHAAGSIDAEQRHRSEEIVQSGAVEMMVRVQRRLFDLANGEGGEHEDR